MSCFPSSILGTWDLFEICLLVLLNLFPEYPIVNSVCCFLTVRCCIHNLFSSIDAISAGEEPWIGGLERFGVNHDVPEEGFEVRDLSKECLFQVLSNRFDHHVNRNLEL